MVVLSEPAGSQIGSGGRHSGRCLCPPPAADTPNGQIAGTSIAVTCASGTIARRIGKPFDTDPWEWTCRFYPGSNPRECTSDTSETFDQARSEFEAAWAVFLSKRAETDFQEWRDERDWTERKYALWDAGTRLEQPSYGPGKPCSRFMKCPCGEVFDMQRPEAVLVHVPHITVADYSRLGV